MQRRTRARPFAAWTTAAAAIVFLAAVAIAARGEVGGSQTGPGPSTTMPGASSAAASLQAAYVDAVASVGPSVVQVQTPAGLGSGVVLDRGGNVVTNNHVVGRYKRFQVTDSSGRRLAATLVGAFPPDDLAVIHVAGGSLRAAVLGDSSKLRVGDIVLAVGNPLGLQSSVTDGIVSALGRSVGEQGGAVLPDLIQTSAAINPGNSGGALVDLAGRVIGIPTLSAVDPEHMQLAGGIGFAIPSNVVQEIAGRLVDTSRAVGTDARAR
jgi:S1-C subfamily serine protease